jgi:drug/metabolite transporter (DMT)-like permease
MQAATNTPPRPLLIALAFATLYLVWGSTYLAIRYMVHGMPPFVGGTFRFLIAVPILLLMAHFKNEPTLPMREKLRALLTGTLMLGIANGLVAWSEQWIPSGVVAVMLAVLPLLLMVFNLIGFDRILPHAVSWLGALIGFVGIAWLSLSSVQSQVPGQAWFGSAVLLASSCSWAIGTLVQRRAGRTASPLQVSGYQMLGGMLFQAVVALGAREWQGFHPSLVSTEAWVAMLYLAIFGSVIAFTAFSWLSQVVHPQKVATYALVNPVVALLLGAALQGETLNAAIGVSSLLILLGVGFVLYSPPGKRLRP